eukprot:7394293-Pyramimonas_sp.AAC.1
MSYSKIQESTAGIYIEKSVEDLQNRWAALRIHGYEQGAAIAAPLKTHVDMRPNERYPENKFGPKDGALLPG